MKRLLRLIVCFAVVGCCLMTACSNSRTIAYVGDAERDVSHTILHTYTSTVHVGDRLYIYVASQTPESVIPFNQETHKYVVETTSVDFVDTTHRAEVGAYEMNNDTRRYTADITGYLVGQDGNIQFPIIGIVGVEGLTTDSVAHTLETLLRDRGYVTDPVVEVKLMNFRVTVVGEVKKPQQINVDGNRLTLLEALAMCGDITMNGKRDDLTVMREHGNVQEFGKVDLTSATLFDSPYYYLQQNDVIYVAPTKRREREYSRNDNIPIYIRIASSVAHIVATATTTIRYHVIDR